jgi:hypothetical protein
VPLLAAAAIVMLLVLLGVPFTRDVGQKEMAHTQPRGTPQVQENPDESTVLGAGDYRCRASSNGPSSRPEASSL